MPKEEMIKKTVYFREYDDSENVFVKESKERFDDCDVGYIKVPLRRNMRDLIVKKSIEFSEKYHISLEIKEDEHFLFVGLSFGKYIYTDLLRAFILICEDVCIAHKDDRTVVEMLFCIDEMIVKNSPTE